MAASRSKLPRNATGGRLETAATNGQEKPESTEFTFVGTDRTPLFTCEQWKIIDGERYNDVEDFKRDHNRATKKLGPTVLKAQELQQAWLLATKEEKEERQREYLRFTLENQETIDDENIALARHNNLGEYRQFILSLDTTGLTVAHRNMIETLTPEDSDRLTPFWLKQNLVEVRAWGKRFRELVGI